MIGHNPGLEELLRYLGGDEVESPSDGKLLPTATLARLEMPNDWSSLEPGCAQLVAVCRPRKSG
jgi:phosphohistidine phosphatase